MLIDVQWSPAALLQQAPSSGLMSPRLLRATALANLIANIGILTIIGAILLVVGLILNFVPIGGTRRRYY